MMQITGQNGSHLVMGCIATPVQLIGKVYVSRLRHVPFMQPATPATRLAPLIHIAYAWVPQYAIGLFLEFLGRLRPEPYVAIIALRSVTGIVIEHGGESPASHVDSVLAGE